jgi:hypothetical protein
MKPTDLRRTVLAAEVPFRLELWSGWPIVCDGPNWSVSPIGEFFTHWCQEPLKAKPDGKRVFGS